VEIFPATDGPVPEIDPSKPHPARIYDYGLGGKNHFAADRAVAEQVLANMPTALTVARENRKFLGRAVRYLVAEAGVRQFLDIGAGLPTTENVHEVAQRVDPAARIVYVDNDPLVLVHAGAAHGHPAGAHRLHPRRPEGARRDPGRPGDQGGWAATGRAYTAARIQGQLRESGEFARMAFAGLELVPPGVVLVSEWRPDDSGPFPAPSEVSCYGGVARKP
jgi:S-adenosyl methyltransferase